VGLGTGVGVEVGSGVVGVGSGVSIGVAVAVGRGVGGGGCFLPPPQSKNNKARQTAIRGLNVMFASECGSRLGSYEDLGLSRAGFEPATHWLKECDRAMLPAAEICCCMLHVCR
jgi:hypothetical protein